MNLDYAFGKSTREARFHRERKRDRLRVVQFSCRTAGPANEHQGLRERKIRDQWRRGRVGVGAIGAKYGAEARRKDKTNPLNPLMIETKFIPA